MTQAVVEAPVQRRAPPERPDRLRLLLLSFLMLFVELMLIRWTAAYVIFISYFTNFVLLASFLGIGLGFLRSSRHRGGRLMWTPLLLAAAISFVVVFPVHVSRVGTRSFVGLLGMPALPIWVVLPAIFALTAAVMASIAENLAHVFARFEPLTAYRLDVAGSLLGIAAFSTLSLLGAPPIAWGVLVAATLGVLGRRELGRMGTSGLVVVLAVLAIVSLVPRQWWSPYYRVTASETSSDGVTGIEVNGLPHQSTLPVSLMPEQQPFYLFPYRHLAANPLREVLIIGAGSGNDVAVALSEGARHVDAVEIDPAILDIGRDLHPNLPYADPRVSAHVGDGRAFLQRSEARYDLIVFALPDSLTLVSGQGSLRLESYLFTREALASVREHLAPGGAFTMYNYYRPDVFDRFAATITSAFGRRPCVDQGPSTLGAREQAVLTVGRDRGDITCSSAWAPRSDAPNVATDDHPFPYLQSRSIPGFYLVTLLLVLAASVLATRTLAGPLHGMRPYADLFLMGAAFLLLETKNVVQFALLFGTTWLVNSLVFAGILLAVLAAIEVAQRLRLPRAGVLYAGLFVALTAAWAVPPASFLALSPVPRFVAAVVLAFLPVFMANLIFSRRFRDTHSSTVAFGTNLLGAMVGGTLEYSAMIVGYRNLLVIVGLLYAGALLATPRAPLAERA